MLIQKEDIFLSLVCLWESLLTESLLKSIKWGKYWSKRFLVSVNIYVYLYIQDDIARDI